MTSESSASDCSSASTKKCGAKKLVNFLTPFTQTLTRASRSLRTVDQTERNILPQTGNALSGRHTLLIRLQAAAIAVTFLCFLLENIVSAQTPSPSPAMQTTLITIQHVSIQSSRSFEATVSAFEAQLGTYDPKAAQFSATASPAELKQTREKIAAMAGKSGFMQFDVTRKHGTLLPLVGQPAGEANQYTIGHPLLAVEMTRHNLAAGLYAPLRVLIYEDEHGITRTEYDLPSSLFGQFHDERITKIGLELDQKLAALVLAASR